MSMTNGKIYKIQTRVSVKKLSKMYPQVTTSTLYGIKKW